MGYGVPQIEDKDDSLVISIPKRNGRRENDLAKKVTLLAIVAAFSQAVREAVKSAIQPLRDLFRSILG